MSGKQKQDWNPSLSHCKASFLLLLRWEERKREAVAEREAQVSGSGDQRDGRATN
jgi:hypothetical protein